MKLGYSRRMEFATRLIILLGVLALFLALLFGWSAAATADHGSPVQCGYTGGEGYLIPPFNDSPFIGPPYNDTLVVEVGNCADPLYVTTPVYHDPRGGP